MTFAVKDFFSNFKKIQKLLRICSYLLKKSLTENFICCAIWMHLYNFTGATPVLTLKAIFMKLLMSPIWILESSYILIFPAWHVS